MSAWRVEPLTEQHLRDIVLREDAARYALGMGEWREIVDRALVAMGGLALLVDDQVVACAGVQQFSPRAGELWMRTGILVDKYPLALAKATKIYLAAVKRFNLKRVQVTVNCNNTKALRWSGRLGFQVEGRMRGYGPNGEDVYMMSKVEA